MHRVLRKVKLTRIPRCDHPISLISSKTNVNKVGPDFLHQVFDWFVIVSNVYPYLLK